MSGVMDDNDNAAEDAASVSTVIEENEKILVPPVDQSVCKSIDINKPACTDITSTNYDRLTESSEVSSNCHDSGVMCSYGSVDHDVGKLVAYDSSAENSDENENCNASSIRANEPRISLENEVSRPEVSPKHGGSPEPTSVLDNCFSHSDEQEKSPSSPICNDTSSDKSSISDGSSSPLSVRSIVYTEDCSETTEAVASHKADVNSPEVPVETSVAMPSETPSVDTLADISVPTAEDQQHTQDPVPAEIHEETPLSSPLNKELSEEYMPEKSNDITEPLSPKNNQENQPEESNDVFSEENLKSDSSPCAVPPVEEESLSLPEKAREAEEEVRSEKPESPVTFPPIKYHGFKKKYVVASNNVKIEKRIKINPFNSFWKTKNHNKTTISDRTESCLAHPEYTQFLGLQPTINFKCNICGASGFDSMHTLNLHTTECGKSSRLSTSTNIKVTRKVYLCSACGTYHENWSLFNHMIEFHYKFICLYCLVMFPSSERLSEHLTNKHQINCISFKDISTFLNCNVPSYFLCCLDCDRSLSEDDDFKHSCSKRVSPIKIQIPEPVAAGDTHCATSKITQPTNLTDSSTVERSTPMEQDPEEKGTVECNDTPNEFDETDKKASDEPNFVSSNEIPVRTSEEEPFKGDPCQMESEPDINTAQFNGSEGEKTCEDIQNEAGIPEITMTNSFTSVVQPAESIISDFPKLKQILKPKRSRNKGGRSQPRKRKPSVKKRKLEPVPSLSYDHSGAGQETISDPNTSFAPHDNAAAENNISLNEEKPENDSMNLKPVSPAVWKPESDKALLKFKLQAEQESDEESDDSNKLSMVIDETPAASDNDSRRLKADVKGVGNSSDESCPAQTSSTSLLVNSSEPKQDKVSDEIQLAGDDVPTMALTLDSKVEDVKVQLVLKECVRTSCMSCNYCRRAVKIAVNGKQLALHLLSEHRYTPVKNDTPDDVIHKLKSSLDELSVMYFNTESYDSSDPSIHVPYDQDTTFDCFQCNFVSTSHKDLYVHKRKSHTRSLLLCIMCKSNFYSYSELLCHLCPGSYNPDEQIKLVEINFRCCFCRLDSIPSAFRLMVHLRKCHHTCDICLEMCSDQQKLSTHMWKHKLNHLCYRCGIAYASKPDITKHLFWKHGTESVLCKKCLQKKWPHVYHFCIPPTSFICEECNSSFSKAVALKVHKRIHSGDLSYECTQCPKKFVSKKLLSRHEDRHNMKQNERESPSKEDKNRDAIIDVTGVSSETPDISANSISDMKESDLESDSNKLLKKNKKDKKGKPVIDVYDLPPLNLSSDSDSSTEGDKKDEPKEELNSGNVEDKKDDSCLPKEEPVPPEVKEENCLATENGAEALESAEKVNISEDPPKVIDEAGPEAQTEIKKEESSENTESKAIVQQNSNDMPNISDAVENIWENFYKTNSQNKNLPYPLCAMKSEVAYGIIMGDHDYCQPVKKPPIKEGSPTSLNLDSLLDPKNDFNGSDSKHNKRESSLHSRNDSPTKKKQKSPKKKKNNSSSSSDTSSDSSSSSCCSDSNCSCSSSSSNSSSSSSSDSDSSASEGKPKTEKRKKKKEKKSKVRNDSTGGKTKPEEPEPEKEVKTDPEGPPPPPQPLEDPAIRESELETDESSTDEEFYDRQPQKITHHTFGDKRSQASAPSTPSATPTPVGSITPTPLTPSANTTARHSPAISSAPSTPLAGVNNGTLSPQPLSLLEPTTTPSIVKDMNESVLSTTGVLSSGKRKVTKTRRRRNMSAKKHAGPPSKMLLHHTPPVAAMSPSGLPFKPFPSQKLKDSRPPSYDRTPQFLNRNFPPESVGSGSENESVRASKRRRIPNKFYGYSSGEEEDKGTPVKWKKQEVFVPTPPPAAIPQPVAPKPVHTTTPQTPKIQLSFPKQIIRKPTPQVAKFKNYSSSDSSDSATDDERRVPPQHKVPVISDIPKVDKNVYCYCRCPYDEVSEMIACDDSACSIEWFHFECVGITVPPKGQWYCPECRKRRGLPS